MSMCRGIAIASLMLGGLILCAPPAIGRESGKAASTARFEEAVAPVLVSRCLGCHGGDKSGGLDLRSEKGLMAGSDGGAVVVPGKPGESELIELVESGEMPKEGEPLDDAAVEALRQWVEDGASFPEGRKLDPYERTTEHRAGYDWWSLQPIERPTPPEVEHEGRVRTPIDRFIWKKLEAKGLSMSAPADRRTLIHRVTYDLTGMRPTYEQVQRFVNDERPDAYRRLVDRLLQSPRYGEHWGRHWLDVVRFAESNGFERDRIRRNFWRYRDYVIQSFNEDKPYDEFVREQVAGDAMVAGDPSDPEKRIATGFLVAGPKNDVATQSKLAKMRYRQDELDEYARAIGNVFLGLTVGCARCHDHKFDPVPTEDYYRLTAVFSGLDRGNGVVASPEQKKQRRRKIEPIKQQLAANQREIDTLREGARRTVLAQRAAERDGAVLPGLSYRKNIDPFKPVRARFVRFVVTEVPGGSKPCIDEIEVYAEDDDRNIALAERGAKATASSLLPGYEIHQIDHLNDGLYGNEHSWISNEPGGGWAMIELPEPTRVDRVVWGRDRKGAYTDRLAVSYRIEVSLDGERWRTVSGSDRRGKFVGGEGEKIPRKTLRAAMSEAQRQRFDKLQALRDRLKQKLDAVPDLPVSYIAKDSAPKTTHILRRGSVRSEGKRVEPGALRAVKAMDSEMVPDGDRKDTGPNRRLELAEWLTNPANPLPARVMVNRIWHYHFGEGIVRTPNDFGFNGSRPTHPELLDWLAAEFVAGGWTMKRMHRMIVLSEAYRQSVGRNEKAASIDGGNRLLWRMNKRRMIYESIRDNILRVAGNLKLQLGGPSYRLFRYRDGNVPDYILLEDPGRETWRRTVYSYNIRTFAHPLASSFDCPSPSVMTAKRNTSVTPLQAFSLLNNPFVFRQAEHFADRVRERGAADPAEQAAEAYRLALSREPTASEQSRAAAFIREHGLMSFCRVLVNTNEFLYIF